MYFGHPTHIICRSTRGAIWISTFVNLCGSLYKLQAPIGRHRCGVETRHILFIDLGPSYLMEFFLFFKYPDSCSFTSSPDHRSRNRARRPKGQIPHPRNCRNTDKSLNSLKDKLPLKQVLTDSTTVHCISIGFYHIR